MMLKDTRSGIGRSRSAIRGEEERNLDEQIVIQKNTQQPEPEEDRELETRCFDQICETAGLNVVRDHEMVEGNICYTPYEEDEDEGNMSPTSYNEGNMTPTPYQGNSLASSSDSSNSYNHEPTISGNIQSGVLLNCNKKSLTTLQMTPSRPISSFVKDSSVSAFQEFYNRVFKILHDGVPLITVRVDTAVFGTDMEVHLVMNDVLAMCYMEDLSVNCVVVYIRHLYDVLVKREREHKFEFINPASVSSAKDGDLSKIITSRLDKSTCEWVLIPVNPEGAGWLLAVVHMETMSCYWLDPSGSRCQSNIKHFVTLGLQSLQKDRVWKKSPIWHIIKCPTQKNKVECGFYVLKFMREIIIETHIFTRSEPFPKPTYEQDEIDEVRLEWIQTVGVCLVTYLHDSSVSAIQNFYGRAIQKFEGGSRVITVRIDGTVFGRPAEVYLNRNDIDCMCLMKAVSVKCVVVYIGHLYNILVQKGIQHEFGFINPSSVSCAKGAELSDIITAKFKNLSCKWVLIPFNREGSWVLVVVHMETMDCYWLDTSESPTQPNIRESVSAGLQVLPEKDGMGTWNLIKCPKPKSSGECGFYVMKFMREIIDVPNIFTRSLPFPNPAYEQDEIDAMRLEWVQTVEAAGLCLVA